MRIPFIFAILVAFSTFTFAQKSTGRSQIGKLPVGEPVIKITNEQSADKGIKVYSPPLLTADIAYSEPSGNNYLDAGETGNLHVIIKNLGKSLAEDCVVVLQENPVNPDIRLSGSVSLGMINPDEVKQLDFKLEAAATIKTGQLELTLKVIEKKGFDLDPEKIVIIPTREFQPAILAVVDYGIEDQNRNMKIEKREVVDITFRIQNKGENPAFGTKAKIRLGENVVPVDFQESFDLGDIPPGSFKDIKGTFITNSRTTEVKMGVIVTDASGKCTSQKNINLPFDVIQKKPDEIVIAKNDEKKIEIPDVAGLRLDIAENIPVAKQKNESAVAVIIGNRNYEKTSPVAFALNDAALVKNYVVSALGYSEDNILYVEDARQSDFRSLFGNETNIEGRLYSYAQKGLSEIFIYYSGHGAPDLNKNKGYLLPVDCDPNMVALNGYSLRTFYDNIGKIASIKQLPHVTIVLEACFSGESNKGSLLTNISAARIKPETEFSFSGYNDISVFTSASGDQVSSWYNDKKQSLFTYFFLKGLQGQADFNQDGKIEARELYIYTADEINGVPYWASRLYVGRTQTPSFYGKDFELFR